ncbi:MAG: Rrf2 family transcriptional regulator [Eubacteriales bacterium]|nr:Rrf2 family transcriptional regulator [Eubacteriales bacterium]
MIISTKGRYGLRAMFELAKAYGQDPLSIKQIAAMQNLSEQYLEQIFSKLKGAGLVRSTRGAGGGYTLAETPGGISVGQVLTALEGELVPADCVGDDAAGCAKAGLCTTHIIWQRIYDGFTGVVNAITLQDMVDDFHRLIADRPQAKNVKC